MSLLQDQRPLVRSPILVQHCLPIADRSYAERPDERTDELDATHPRRIAGTRDSDSVAGLLFTDFDVCHARTLTGATR